MSKISKKYAKDLENMPLTPNDSCQVQINVRPKSAQSKRLLFYQPQNKFHWTNFTYIVNFKNFKISWNCDTDFGYWFGFGFERNNKRKAWICTGFIPLNFAMLKLSLKKQGLCQSMKKKFKLSASEY